MKKLNLILITLITVALAALLSGCTVGDNSLEGRNIVTFRMNGGILNYGTSSTGDSINYAYHPGTLIKDPAQLPGYSLTRSGFVFTGWYTDEACTKEWDFDGTYFTDPTLTLYAGWVPAITFSFSVNYAHDGETVELGRNEVSAGEAFEDWKKHANKRDGYTPVGYFKDPECTEPWDFSFTHPGGDADLDIPVYVSYIEGDWKLVYDYAGLKSAVKSGNVYLMNDVDCGGENLYFSGTFNKIFEGNGHKIENFTVQKSGTSFAPSCAIFQTLGASAEVRNVSFEKATYRFFDIISAEDVRAQVAALAVGMTKGAKVASVSVSGTLETDYDDGFARLNDVFYYGEGDDTSALDGVSGFTANIVVNKNS